MERILFGAMEKLDHPDAAMYKDWRQNKDHVKEEIEGEPETLKPYMDMEPQTDVRLLENMDPKSSQNPNNFTYAGR